MCLLLTLLSVPFEGAQAVVFQDTFSISEVLDQYQTNRGDLKNVETVSFQGDDRLKMTIDSNFGFEDSGFRFQGLERRFGAGMDFLNAPMGSQMSIDFYLDPAWENGGNQREISFWAQTTGANNYWPNFGFYTDGVDTAHFFTWPEETGDNFKTHPLPIDFEWGWNTFTYELGDAANFWSVNGELFAVNDAFFESFFEPDNLQTMLIMPRNFGEDDYMVYADNFIGIIPEPSNSAMIIGGLAALMGFRRRNNKLAKRRGESS